MNVAVTGSHGYIGSVLRKMLTEQGHQVYCCDRKLKTKQLTARQKKYWHGLSHGSFDDWYFINRIVESDCKVVFHLAASSLLGPSAKDPLSYYYNNTARTTNFLQRLDSTGWTGHIIFSSTAAAYGAQDEPVNEDSPKQPCNHYGHSKLNCEQVLENMHLYGTRVTTFRYFNVVGAYDDVGQEYGEPHLLTRVCNAAIGRIPLTVYGNNYDTRDGTCIRDYVHVRDVCQAQIHAMGINQINKQGADVFNLGTHQGTSVLEMIQQFQDVTGVKFDYTMGAKREGDPAFLVANPQKFIDTGFKYQYSNKEEIITSAWKYFNRSD
jgi:UDP-glucose 4-epimerase